MKPKLLFLILFCILSMLSFAAERTIEVNSQAWRESGRSIPSIPMLSHDGNILFIYSAVPLENLQVRVKDEFGNVVYVDNVSIAAGHMYSFVLESVSPGKYVIELLCGKESLWGDFKIDG